MTSGLHTHMYACALARIHVPPTLMPVCVHTHKPPLHKGLQQELKSKHQGISVMLKRIQPNFDVNIADFLENSHIFDPTQTAKNQVS